MDGNSVGCTLSLLKSMEQRSDSDSGPARIAYTEIVEGAGERRRCQPCPRHATSAPGPRSAGNAPHPAWIQQHVFLLVPVPLPCWSRCPASRTPGIGLQDLVQDRTRTESLGIKRCPEPEGFYGAMTTGESGVVAGNERGSPVLLRRPVSPGRDRSEVLKPPLALVTL